MPAATVARESPEPLVGRVTAGMSQASLGLAVACVMVGGLLRFVTLDLQSFDHDESVTAGRMLDASLLDTLAVLPESERTPPSST